MSLLGILNSARDGLLAQSAGVAVAGQNVTNANTPGYVRRGVILQSRTLGAQSPAAGGVDVVGISRAFDRVAHQRLTLEDARRGAAQSRANALAQVEGVMSPGIGGIAERVSALFTTFARLSGAPADRSLRASVMSDVESLGTAMRGAVGDLDRLRTDLYARGKALSTDVNERTARIAQLNGEIAEATARGDGAADLRDQRDLLVREVGERVGARVIEDASGRITLFAMGTALVEGNTASTIEMGQDTAGAMQVRVRRQPGGLGDDVTRAVTEGTLGGVREARDVDLPATTNALDAFAFDLVGAINAVHGRAYGLDGATGRPLFTPITAVAGAAARVGLDAGIQNEPDRVGAASTSGTLPGGNGAALELARLATTALGGGNGTPSERFGGMLGDVGTRRASADNELALRQDTVQQAESLLESSSGVSLDEEMVNLTRFQRAYDASTKVLRVADELLDSLIKGV